VKDYILNLDRPRKLVFDFDAWDLIAERYAAAKEGEDFDLSKLPRITFKEIPFLAYAGLRWEDSSLTEDKIKRMLSKSIADGAHTMIGHLQLVANAVFTQAGMKEFSLEDVFKGASKAEGGVQKKVPEPAVPSSRKKGK
jgi:hypothetical protein